MKQSIIAATLLASALPAHAVDSVGLELGRGNATDMVRLSAQWDWKKRWLPVGGWHLGGAWEASAGYWHGHSGAGGNRDLGDFGITPVFRFQRDDPTGFAPYLEAAIGIHLLTGTSINADRKFGSPYQFGDHLGIGARFGAKGQYDLAYRYQHLSNGSIKQPNQGINFSIVRFSYHF